MMVCHNGVPCPDCVEEGPPQLLCLVNDHSVPSLLGHGVLQLLDLFARSLQVLAGGVPLLPLLLCAVHSVACIPRRRLNHTPAKARGSKSASARGTAQIRRHWLTRTPTEL